MPFLALIAMYAVQIARRPLDVRLKKRHAGPLAVAALSVVLYLTWDGLRPGGVSSAYFLGEFAGVTSVYLMTWSLVLATRLRWLEQWFGGLDRMYFWHKQYALWAMLLLLPHILVTGRAAQTGITATEAARTEQLGRLLGVISALGLLTLVAVSLARVSRIVALPYERWLLLHRFTGLLVLIALVHGWVLDRVIGASAALKAIYVLIGIAGMAAYGYDELIRRRRAPQADYTVRSVRRVQI
jgi:predicted ferric reductase